MPERIIYRHLRRKAMVHTVCHTQPVVTGTPAVFERREKGGSGREMSKRKTELMYEMFGKNEKYCCAECDHFRKINYHDKTYRKCEVYGLTRSEATDWKASNVACGLAPDKTYMGKNIVEMVTPHKDSDEPVKGQMSIEDFPEVLP